MTADNLLEHDDLKTVVERLHTREEDLRWLLRLQGWTRIEIEPFEWEDGCTRSSWGFKAYFNCSGMTDHYVYDLAGYIMGQLRAGYVRVFAHDSQPPGAVITKTTLETYYNDVRLRMEIGAMPGVVGNIDAEWLRKLNSDL